MACIRCWLLYGALELRWSDLSESEILVDLGCVEGQERGLIGKFFLQRMEMKVEHVYGPCVARRSQKITCFAL